MKISGPFGKSQGQRQAEEQARLAQMQANMAAARQAELDRLAAQQTAAAMAQMQQMQSLAVAQQQAEAQQQETVAGLRIQAQQQTDAINAARMVTQAAAASLKILAPGMLQQLQGPAAQLTRRRTAAQPRATAASSLRIGNTAVAPGVGVNLGG